MQLCLLINFASFPFLCSFLSLGKKRKTERKPVYHTCIVYTLVLKTVTEIEYNLSKQIVMWMSSQYAN